MQEYLFHCHGGHFASRSGKLYWLDLGSDVQVQIYDRLDGKQPADLPASRVILRFAKPSIHWMASASRGLLAFVSMLFAPSFGPCHMNIPELIQSLQSLDQILKMNILGITTYSSQLNMFIVLQLRQGCRECWLKLNRQRVESLNASFIFSGMQSPAKDEVYHILFS